MNRIDRLFGILTLLQSRKYVTAERISATFNISIRTVYRDVKALGEQGIPVSFEQPKGYFIVQGYFLPPVSFTSEEANALLLLESIAQGFADRSIKAHYSSALNKVKAVLGNSQKEKMELLGNSTRMQLPTRLVSDFDYLSLLQSGISSRIILEMNYSNLKGENSTRLVEPIGLIFYAFSWHFIAWCHYRKEYRDFKLARINGLKLTDKPFSKTGHIELNDYMKQLPVSY